MFCHFIEEKWTVFRCIYDEILDIFLHNLIFRLHISFEEGSPVQIYIRYVCGNHWIEEFEKKSWCKVTLQFAGGTYHIAHIALCNGNRITFSRYTLRHS